MDITSLLWLKQYYFLSESITNDTFIILHTLLGHFGELRLYRKMLVLHGM